MLALRRLGRYGLVSIDGGLDFRHPGNAQVAGPVGSVAGEDLATPMTLFDVAELRRLGPAEAAGRAVAILARRGVEGFWVHVDTDVLDPEVMPAVGTPEPGGLSHPELVALLGTLAASELAVGMQLTIFDPDLDPDGRLAAELTGTVVAGLRPRVA